MCAMRADMSGLTALGTSADPAQRTSLAELATPSEALPVGTSLRAGGADDEVHLGALVEELRGEVARVQDARSALEASREELQLMIQSMPQIVWITRPDGWHTYFNHQWLDFTGLTLEESLGHGWNPPFHPDDRARAAARWEQATSTGEPYEIEYRLRRADGTYHWMLGRAMPLRNAAGTIVKWFGTCTDIEAQKQAQAQIEEQARLLDLAQDAIFVEDLKHRIVYWNHGAERIYGWSAEDAVGHTLEELISPDRSEIDSALAVVCTRGEWSGELRFVDVTGATRVMESRLTLLRNADGGPKGVLAVNTDVTERRATEAKFLQVLQDGATRDPLTGLPNRALLADRLDKAVAHSQRSQSPLAVLFIDLDDFKDINDGSGHLLGDKVLMEVARRLGSTLRDADTVARFGGDEFVVLLPDTGAVTADDVAHRLLAAVREPMQVDGHRLHVSASIGVAVSPPVEPGALLRSADAAVYYAKSCGRAQVRAFVGELSAKAEERLYLSSELRDALERDQLNLVYQPIVDLDSGNVIGIEALARWSHPARGQVPPDVFVAVAEQTGVARHLDSWVVRRACTEMAALRRAGAVNDDSYLAVNVTALSVGDPTFPAVVQQALADACLPPTALVVEVTETGVIKDLDAGIRTLTVLRDLGVRVAIDDFGTGWSSLTYLKRLPASLLKLDRSFVARLQEDEEDRAIAAAVVLLGQATGMSVVAEGVETTAQLEVLRALRCTAGQGYLWHHGVPVDRVAQAVRRCSAAMAKPASEAEA